MNGKKNNKCTTETRNDYRSCRKCNSKQNRISSNISHFQMGLNDYIVCTLILFLVMIRNFTNVSLPFILPALNCFSSKTRNVNASSKISYTKYRNMYQCKCINVKSTIRYPDMFSATATTKCIVVIITNTAHSCGKLSRYMFDVIQDACELASNTYWRMHFRERKKGTFFFLSHSSGPL